MIDDLKLGIKTLKYAYGTKSTIFGVVCSILFGVLMCIMNVCFESKFPGGYFFILVVLFVTQLAASLGVAALISSSPKKKNFHVGILSAISVLTTLIMFFSCVITELILSLIFPQKISFISSQILCTAVLAAIVLQYVAISYKFFVIGTIIFLTEFLCFMRYGLITEFGYGNARYLALATLIGLAIIALASVVEYIILKLLYRFPVSKMSQNAFVRKTM